MVEPSGSEASAFAAVAVLTELIRTLHAEGVLENLDVVGLLQEAKASVSAGSHGQEAADIIKVMLHDYGQ